MKSRMTLCILLMLSAVLIMPGCGAKEESVETEARPVVSTEVSETIQPVEDLDYCIVSTEFGELYYQEQWVEFIRTEQSREGDVIRVTFKAEMNNSSYNLFTVMIGGGEGGLVGQLTDASGVARDVYVQVWELDQYSELTEGECNRLYAMQEEINYVIENLK